MWGGRGGQLCVWKVISRNHTQKYPLQYPSCARQMVWRIGPVSRAVWQSISLFGYDLDKWLDRLVVNDHCHTSGQPNSRTNQLQYSANMLELSFDRTQARTTIVVLTMPGAALVLNIWYRYVSHTLVDVRARVRARPDNLANTDTD